MKSVFAFIFLSPAILMFAGCKAQTNPENAAYVEQSSAAIHDWMQARYQDSLSASPMTQAKQGLQQSNDRLDDFSQIAADEKIAVLTAWQDELKREFLRDQLAPFARLQYDLFDYQVNDAVLSHRFAKYDYIFTDKSGPHIDLPSFMINLHKIESHDDARAYIARLSQFETYLGAAQARGEAQFDAGAGLPKFVYPKIRKAALDVINGRPFSPDGDSPLLADFISKIRRIELPAEREMALIEEAKTAMVLSVQPAYLSLIEQLDRHASVSTADAGVWKFPDGADFYADRFRHFTTTDLSADDVHNIGLNDVGRHQDALEDLKRKVEFDGTLETFFQHLRSDPLFAAGDLKHVLSDTSYQIRLTDGTKPIFITGSQKESFAELRALHALDISKQSRNITDPYKEIALRSLEIFYAARIVADTGIHSRKWTRAMAIKYMMENTAQPEQEILDTVDHIILQPGRSTAGYIKLIKIKEIQKSAQDRLGDRFVMREFIDAGFGDGPLPVTILHTRIENWIETKG